MKKIINFIRRRSTIILTITLLVFIIIIAIILGLFLPKLSGNEYGSRLDGIENVPITNEIKNSITESIATTEKSTKSSVTLQGKIIKVNITIKDDVKMDDAKTIYDAFKDKFTKEILAFYDIQIMLVHKDYASFGYLKAGNETLKWTNNKQEV